MVHRIPWSDRKWVRFLRTPVDVFRVLFARRDTFDVVHLHQHSWFGLYSILIVRLLGKPILTKLPNIGLPDLLKMSFGRLRLRILFSSDALVALSGQSLEELLDLGFPRDRILATPNGIVLPVVPKKRLFENNASRPCRVVFVGRLHVQKGIASLPTIWRNVVSRSTVPAMLEFWGAGPLEASLRQGVHKAGLENSVLFRGHVDGVRDEIEKADILILPSLREGNSNAILEAMAAGLPVVSTRVGGTPMLVGDAGARFLSDPEDVAAIQANLLELIEDRALRERTGAAMRQRVAEHFDMERIATNYVAVYRHLADRHRDKVHEASSGLISTSLPNN
jgi:glycosyltransferase involved in cell wall biosynthesis